MRDPNRSDRIRGDGRPSQNALPLKILRRPQPPEPGAQNDGLNALIGGRLLGVRECFSGPCAVRIVASWDGRSDPVACLPACQRSLTDRP